MLQRLQIAKAVSFVPLPTGSFCSFRPKGCSAQSRAGMALRYLRGSWCEEMTGWVWYGTGDRGRFTGTWLGMPGKFFFLISKLMIWRRTKYKREPMMLGKGKKLIAEKKLEYVNLYLPQITGLAVKTIEKAKWCSSHYLTWEFCTSWYSPWGNKSSSHVAVATPTIILNIPCFWAH